MNKLNLTLPYSTYPNFDFGSLENGECISEFWFEKKDVYTLGETLEIPQSVICYNGTKVDGIKFLCIFFKRFAYPCRYSEMISFGRSVPELSYVSNHFMNFVYDRWGHLIKTMNLQWLVPVNLHLFIDAIHASESLLENCLGFIDETNRSICRSTKDQCILYSGHKKVQAIKFQSVVALNGLIANLYGPVNGQHLTAICLLTQALFRNLQQYACGPKQHFLCGDLAYPLWPQLMGSFQGSARTPLQNSWNKVMCLLRVSVEWILGDILDYLKFLEFKMGLKLQLSAVGKMYIVCALMQDARTCIMSIKQALTLTWSQL